MLHNMDEWLDSFLIVVLAFHLIINDRLVVKKKTANNDFKTLIWCLNDYVKTVICYRLYHYLVQISLNISMRSTYQVRDTNQSLKTFRIIGYSMI